MKIDKLNLDGKKSSIEVLDKIFSAKITMDIFEEAGLPRGVINMIFGDPEIITDKVLSSNEFAGIHFTGSTSVFKNIC